MNAPSSRMIGFDMARAFAMLGMMIVNFKTVMNAGENGPDWLAQLLQIALNYWQGWNPLLPFMDYLDFWTIEGFLRNLLYNGYHPLFPWFCFFLLGMWLGRQNMMDRAYRNKMLGYSIAAAVVLEIVAFFLIKGSSLAVGLDAAQFLFSTKTYPPNLFYILSSSSTAVAVIVICIYFAEKFAAHWFTVTMVRTGQLTLTHYVSHVFIGIGLLAVLGKLENQTLMSSLFYSCAFFSASALQMTF